MAKVDKRANATETELMNRLKAHLEDEKPLRDLELNDEEHKMLRGYGLLSLKPVVVVINLGETWQEPEEIVGEYNHDKASVLSLQGSN